AAASQSRANAVQRGQGSHGRARAGGLFAPQSERPHRRHQAARRNPVKRALVLSILTLGCGIVQPKADQTRFFVLTALRVTQRHPVRGFAPALGLGPITIPDYLDRSSIVTSVGPNELLPADLDR